MINQSPTCPPRVENGVIVPWPTQAVFCGVVNNIVEVLLGKGILMCPLRVRYYAFILYLLCVTPTHFGLMLILQILIQVDIIISFSQ